jgi:hypothetical protein
VNIFILHRDPYVAASMCCDKHIVKMPIESCQMLATIIKAHGGTARYKPTHAGHPCTIWAGRTAHNFAWLWHHGMALCQEYTLRYGKTHACEQLLKGELRRLPTTVPRAGLQEFVQCMPEQYRTDDPVIAYRRFYLGDKAHFCKWTNRIEPLWFTLKQPELEM